MMIGGTIRSLPVPAQVDEPSLKGMIQGKHMKSLTNKRARVFLIGEWFAHSNMDRGCVPRTSHHMRMHSMMSCTLASVPMVALSMER